MIPPAVLEQIINNFREAAPAVVMLVVMEGLLSVDNMLAIASLASELPENQRRRALRFGMIGAYAFRALALLFATLIARNHVMLVIGAGYLIHLMLQHFGELAESEASEDHAPPPVRTFWQIVIEIQFLDLSLSFDNVIVAAGVARDSPWILYTGVGLGLLTLWLFATLSLRLIEKYPVLNHAAFLLIGMVGVLLLLDAAADVHTTRLQKFAGSALVISVCLLYARSAALQKALRPLFVLGRPPLRSYVRATSACLAPVGRLFRRLRIMLKRRF